MVQSELVVNEVVGQSGTVGGGCGGKAAVSDDQLQLWIPQCRRIHVARDRLTTHDTRRETQLIISVTQVACHHKLTRLAHSHE